MSTFKLTITEAFTRLAQGAATALTKNIYTMLPVAQQAELDELREAAHEKGKKKRKNSKKRTDSKRQQALQMSTQIAKESRLVPRLILQMELFERSILKLHNLHHRIICPTFYRSTARDFRIQLDELEAALLQNQGSEETNEEEENSTLLSGTDEPDATSSKPISGIGETMSLVISDTTQI